MPAGSFRKFVTKHGRNPAPVDIENIPLFTGFCTSKRWLFGFLNRQQLRMTFWKVKNNGLQTDLSINVAVYLQYYHIYASSSSALTNCIYCSKVELHMSIQSVSSYIFWIISTSPYILLLVSLQRPIAADSEVKLRYLFWPAAPWSKQDSATSELSNSMAAGMRRNILRTAHYVSCFALIHASLSQCMICKIKIQYILAPRAQRASVHALICPSVHLSIYLQYLSIYLSIYLSS